MKTKYIHYGNIKFDKDRFREVENEDYRTKPKGGFWASPIDSKFGWKYWCEREKFRECKEENSFIFTLKDDANVIHIRSSDDLIDLPKAQESIKGEIYLDFEELRKQGVDAIELHLSEDYELYYILYTWDCDSILIMNKDIIESEGDKNDQKAK